MRWDIRERTTEIRHCKITEEATRKSPRQGIILTLRSDSSVVFHDKLLQQKTAISPGDLPYEKRRETPSVKRMVTTILTQRKLLQT